MGILGVGVFFFISGYLLQRRYPSIETPQVSYAFFNRRAWRIFPLYWVALLVDLTLGRLVTQSGEGISTSGLLIHLLGLQMVFFPSYINVLAFWFIGMIVVFYLLYPLLVYQGPPVEQLFLRAGAIFVLLGIVRALTGLFGGGIFEYFPVFVLGVAAGMTDFLRCDRYRSWRLALAVVAVPAIGYAYFTYTDVAGMDVGGGLSFPIVITVGAAVGGRLIASLSFIFLLREVYVLLAPQSSRILHLVTAGATASYAVYLFHGPYLAVVGSLISSPPGAVFLAKVASLPILFLLCFYVQTSADRLITWARHRPSKRSDHG